MSNIPFQAFSYRGRHAVYTSWLPNTYLERVVNIGACIYSARVNHLGQSLVGSDPVADADRGSRYRFVLIRTIVDGHGIVKRHITRNSRIVLDVVQHRRASRPEDYGVRVRISRSHPVSEVQLRWSIGSRWIIALVDLVDGDAQTRVIMRRTSVVEVVGKGRRCNAGQGQDVQKLEHGRGCEGTIDDSGCTEYCLRTRSFGSISERRREREKGGGRWVYLKTMVVSRRLGGKLHQSSATLSLHTGALKPDSYGTS